MNNLKDIFLEELADLYNAETQLTKALPKMAKAASTPDLKEAFESHLEETKEHVQRLTKVFGAFKAPVKGKTCKAMKGLIQEGAEIIEEEDASTARDAALIAAAQKVEHYEIASYGCLATWAKLLGNKNALNLLKETISQEKAADEKLTEIAESSINEEALAA
jgi:ferritin-like metal-binding protein YciE